MHLVIRRLAVGVPLLLCLFVALGEPVQAKSFASCAELRKTYPRGVAQTSSAAKATGARLNATVYRANIRLDANSNKSACERGEASAAPSTQPAPVETVSQANARKSAASYLRYSSFSRKGLVDQLVFEGYSNADAEYGVDIQRADWNEQAKKSAASYLKYSAFSRSGLIKQLVFEGFSEAEAMFGVDAQQANWNEQAAKSAASYLKYSSFSRSGLLDQLRYEGFTETEALFGVTAVGY